MKKYYIGTDNHNIHAFLCDNGLNPHVVAVGCSGSGKSTAMMNLCIDRARQGGIVIVFNHKNCLNGFSSDLKKRYLQYAEILDVGRDGIALPLFKPIQSEDGGTETESMMIDRVVAMVKDAADLSRTQEDLFRVAIDNVVEDGKCDFNQIFAMLENHGSVNAKNVASKIRFLCRDRIRSDGDFLRAKKNIIEINLNGIDVSEQEKMVNFLLEYLYRVALKGVFADKEISIYLDEAQTMDFSEDSSIFKLVNEGRKHGIRLMLVAPQLLASRRKNMDILTQFGTCLYFKPLATEVKRTAELIDCRRVDTWIFRLGALKTGQFVIKGNYEANGVIYDKPIVLRMDCPMEEPLDDLEVTVDAQMEEEILPVDMVNCQQNGNSHIKSVFITKKLHNQEGGKEHDEGKGQVG